MPFMAPVRGLKCLTGVLGAGSLGTPPELNLLSLLESIFRKFVLLRFIMQLARRDRRTAITPYVARAAASAATRAVSNAIYNSLPSFESVGKGAKGFYAGWKAGSETHKARKMSAIEDMGISVSAAPAAVSHRIVTRRPTVSTKKGRGASTVVTHRELITGSVVGSTSFTILPANVYALNPGLPNSFPLLSGIAKNYEEYRWRYIRFLWVPIAPTSAQGDVIMIQEYDANAPQPSSEVDAVNHAGSMTCNIWKDCTATFNGPALHSTGTRRYVRTTAVAGDPKTYDSGIFYLGINNTADSTTKIGKLFVEYSVELFVPRNPSLQGSLPTTVAIWQNSNAQPITTATNTPLLYNTSLTSNSLGITLATDTKTFTLPVGFYRIEAFCDCKDTAAETFGGGLDILNPTNAITTSSGANFLVTNVANGIQGLYCVAYVQITPTSNTIVVNVQLTGAAGTLSIPVATSLVAFSVI